MRRLLLVGCLAGLFFAPTTLSAQWSLGGQFSWGDDFDFAFGGRVIWDWPFEPGAFATGSFDLFFPKADVDYWEVNINIGQPIPIKSDTFKPYAGAGLNWAHISAGGTSDNRFGLNLLAGLRYMLPSVAPFGELRWELGGGKQFVITAGVMFNISS